MKKICLSIATAIFALSVTVNAQDFGNLLNTASKVVRSYAGKGQKVELPGNWTYTGVAVSLLSENTLSNIAGTAASSTAENKINEYLTKVGLTSGAMNFSFKEDLTFTCSIKGIPISGTWKTINDAKTIQLQYGKALKFLSMTGTVESTSDGCKILFDSNKFLSFIKTALNYVAKQSSKVKEISGFAGNYNNMKLGFNLSKSK